MFKLIKLHLCYLFSKTILVIIFLSLVLCICSLISSSNSISTLFSSSFSMLKIIIVFVNAFIYSYSLSDNHDYYYYYLLGRASRSKYIFSKILSLMVVSLSINIIVFFLFLLFGYLFTNNYYFENIFLIKFGFLFLLTVVYGLYGFLFCLITRSNFTVILVITFFILGDSQNLWLFPNDNIINIYSYLYMILLIVFICIINVLYFKNKEINY